MRTRPSRAGALNSSNNRKVYIVECFMISMDWQKRVKFDVLVLIGMLVIFALAANHYKNKYEACKEASKIVLLEQVSATEFVVKNHEVLEFPSCYQELTYLGTQDPNTLYVANGTLMGWRMGDTAPYCWNAEKDYFDCEELCTH